MGLRIKLYWEEPLWKVFAGYLRLAHRYDPNPQTRYSEKGKKKALQIVGKHNLSIPCCNLCHTSVGSVDCLESFQDLYACCLYVKKHQWGWTGAVGTNLSNMKKAQWKQIEHVRYHFEWYFSRIVNIISIEFGFIFLWSTCWISSCSISSCSSPWCRCSDVRPDLVLCNILLDNCQRQLLWQRAIWLLEDGKLGWDALGLKKRSFWAKINCAM